MAVPGMRTSKALSLEDEKQKQRRDDDGNGANDQDEIVAGPAFPRNEIIGNDRLFDFSEVAQDVDEGGDHRYQGD